MQEMFKIALKQIKSDGILLQEKRRDTIFLILLKYRKVFLLQHVQPRWQIININFVLQFVTEVLVLRLEEQTKFTPIQRGKLIKTMQDKKLVSISFRKCLKDCFMRLQNITRFLVPGYMHAGKL